MQLIMNFIKKISRGMIYLLSVKMFTSAFYSLKNQREIKISGRIHKVDQDFSRYFILSTLAFFKLVFFSMGD